MIGIAVGVLVGVLYGISMSPLLAVDTLQVRGASHLTRAEITAAAGVHEGDAMAWIDPSAAVEGIEALPYVRDATVTRQWPQTVQIRVHERTPAAWVEGPGATVLVDRTGRVLETVDAAPLGMPQLLGAGFVPAPGGTIDAVGAARVAGSLSGFAALGTRSVEVTDHGVVLHLVSGPEVRLGDAVEVGVKLRAGFAVVGECEGRALEYVDVSVPTNPVAGGCGA